MISSKYLIIIALIFALLILYYFYDEIKKVKKLYLPTYQKTMTLETKFDEHDKRINELYRRKITKIDSPALSITYQSDMIGRGNLSAKYADLSERETKDLLERIRAEKQNQLISKPTIVNSDFTSESESRSKKKLPEESIFENSGVRIFAPNPDVQSKNQSKFDVQSKNQSKFDVQSKNQSNFDVQSTDTFNVKITDLISNGKIYKKQDANTFYNLNQNLEYDTKLDRVLEGFSKNSLTKSETFSKNDYKSENSSKFNSKSESAFDETEIDHDVLKSISESIHGADIHSETVLSDIPVSNQKSQRKSNNKTAKVKKDFI